MAAVTKHAPGKIILFGEHAVVYGQPAIAIPVSQLQATARVTPLPDELPGRIRLEAADIHLDVDLSDLPADQPLAFAIRQVLGQFGAEPTPALHCKVTSTIPIGAGMGSSAAISVAIIRALSSFLGQSLSNDAVCALAFEVEKLYHGTPSGIDNTVITYEQPVMFQKEQSLQRLSIQQPTWWVIADTGVTTPTRQMVAELYQRYEKEPEFYTSLFTAIGNLVREAQTCLVQGDIVRLGELLDLNQTLLAKCQVSHPALEKLISAARNAGAVGAKLSGGGGGGNMIALINPSQSETIVGALQAAGAKRVIVTALKGT